MIKSMTGYGNAAGVSGNLDITIEVKSYNNRYLDCSVRLPRIYSFAEDALKKIAAQHISRGKVEIYVTIDASRADDVEITVNEPLAEAYLAVFKTISERYGLKNDATTLSLSRLPDVLLLKKQEADVETVKNDMCAILETAMQDFDTMRRREGEKMLGDISSRLRRIEELTSLVEERSPQTVAEYRAKLEQKMKEVLATADIDSSRILTEAAIYADKVAVDEETVRLRSHVSQMDKLMQQDASVGRKLDFLIQEFNREANTIGSKCSDITISGYAVDLKAEIEKIREQIQNVE